MRQLLGSMILAFSLMEGVVVHAETFTVDEVKAVYLLNFTSYITWPEDEFSDPVAPFKYCLFKEGSPIREPMTEALRGESVGEHNIQFKIISLISAVKDCQVLYIDKEQSAHAKNILQELADTAVLTVSDLPGFAKAGGGIELYTQAGRVKLLINVKKVDEARLTVSSKLLRVAELINDADIGNEPW